MLNQRKPPSLHMIYLGTGTTGSRWEAVIGRSHITHSADVMVAFHCSLQLQQTNHDQGQFHQVPQRETEGLSA